MTAKFLISWLVLAIVWYAGTYLVHNILLAGDYGALQSLYRTDGDKYLPYVYAAHLIIAGAFLWVYVRGKEARPWLGQGLRYGLVVFCLTVLPTYMLLYAAQPFPASLVIKQILLDGTLLILLAVFVAWLMRERTSA